jgi:hypothetical protein
MAMANIIAAGNQVGDISQIHCRPGDRRAGLVAPLPDAPLEQRLRQPDHRADEAEHQQKFDNA